MLSKIWEPCGGVCRQISKDSATCKRATAVYTHTHTHNASFAAMAAAMASRSSCSSSSLLECRPSTSPGHSISSSCDDALWSDVDLAERYLISSQFDEAASLSSMVLGKLKVVWESSERDVHYDVDQNEIEGIMEAAGIVLIQAYSESSRSHLIFKELEAIFGCIAKVPSSVFVAGLCLQLSARLYLEAQLSIESFLKHWAYSAPNQVSCTFKPALGYSQKCFRLDPARYIEIVDLYCVQVLAKGLGRLNLALQWIEEADIPAERKQDIYEKLNKLASSPSGKEKTDAFVSHPDKVTRSIPESSDYISMQHVSECVDADSGNGGSKKAIQECDLHSSLKSIFLLTPVMEVLSGWMSRTSMTYSDRVSRWKTMRTVAYQNKLPLGGAASVFLMIAIYRNRGNLSRLFAGLNRALRHVLRGIIISLYDFWQLAFNVQLNPLAAVQPLPPTNYGR